MYEHERQERSAAGPLNNVWPEYSGTHKHLAQMDAYLLDRQLDPGLARHNGWYPSVNAGDGHLRVVIPAVPRADNPGHVYWQARDLTGKAHLRYTSPRGPRADALVLVTPDDETEAGAFVIVEGPMDALAAAGEGYVGVAVMGISPPFSTVERIAAIITKTPAVIVFDNEPEATNCAMRLLLTLAAKGCRVTYNTLRSSNDLAKCTVKERREVLKQAFTRHV